MSDGLLLEFLYARGFAAIALASFGIAGLTLWLLARIGQLGFAWVLPANLIWLLVSLFGVRNVLRLEMFSGAGLTNGSVVTLHGVILLYSAWLTWRATQGRLTRDGVIVATVVSIGAAYLLVHLTLSPASLRIYPAISPPAQAADLPM